LPLSAGLAGSSPPACPRKWMAYSRRFRRDSRLQSGCRFHRSGRSAIPAGSHEQRHSVATFSNGDPPVALAPIGGGLWTGPGRRSRQPRRRPSPCRRQSRMRRRECCNWPGGGGQHSTPVGYAGGIVNAASGASRPSRRARSSRSTERTSAPPPVWLPRIRSRRCWAGRKFCWAASRCAVFHQRGADRRDRSLRHRAQFDATGDRAKRGGRFRAADGAVARRSRASSPRIRAAAPGSHSRAEGGGVAGAEHGGNPAARATTC